MGKVKVTSIPVPVFSVLFKVLEIMESIWFDLKMLALGRYPHFFYLEPFTKHLGILTHSHTMTPFDAPGKQAF